MSEILREYRVGQERWADVRLGIREAASIHGHMVARAYLPILVRRHAPEPGCGYGFSEILSGPLLSQYDHSDMD